MNDPSFYVDGNEKFDCRWIGYNEKQRRAIYCLSEEVQKVSALPNNAESSVLFQRIFPLSSTHTIIRLFRSKACPQSCGICCEDDSRYEFDTHKVGEKGCDWIAKNRQGLGIENWRIDEYCDMAFDDGSKVSENCPKACEMCVESTNSPSVSPTTASPISSSCLPGFGGKNCDPICKNDLTYFVPWGKDKGHDCLWVKSDDATRQKYCQSDMVKSKCPISCGECCGNNLDFTFSTDNVGEQDCSWLEKNEKYKLERSELYCKRTVDGRKVHDGKNEYNITIPRITSCAGIYLCRAL